MKHAIKAPISHLLANFYYTFCNTCELMLFISCHTQEIDIIPNRYDISSSIRKTLLTSYQIGMTSVKLSQRSSRVSVGRYGGLRCQEATWGSVAHAEGSLPSTSVDSQAARKGVPCPENCIQGVTPVLCRMALHRETAIG